MRTQPINSSQRSITMYFCMRNITRFRKDIRLINISRAAGGISVTPPVDPTDTFTDIVPIDAAGNYPVDAAGNIPAVPV